MSSTIITRIMTKGDDESDDKQNQMNLTESEQAIMDMLKRANLDGVNRTSNRTAHAFWDTQPMLHSGVEIEGPIEPNKSQDEIRQEPYVMPSGFLWATLDVNDEGHLKELYDLLANNYVEDDDALFRFDYSPQFLQWALTPPGYKQDWLLAVRAEKSQKLVAFISGIPATVQVRAHDPVDMVEINFLCVHKKLRSKRLAPVLIKEITRRVNRMDIFQAVYTAGVLLPVPVASARYHHRSLQPKKLITVGFSRLAPRMTLARLTKLYKLPTVTSTHGLRPMQPSDVPSVTKLLTSYLQKFQLRVLFTEDDIAHWLLPRPKVIQSYVVTSESGDVTDLCSYYHLPSTILGRDDTLFAAYSYYNVATSVSLVDLMRDCLILAKNEGADVFNALNLMDNDEFLKELKFGLGDGNLQYYLYNWGCPTLQSSDIGIVLL